MEKLKQEVNMPVDIVWNNLLKACIDTVNEQPIAYDVEQVVKELEERQKKLIEEGKCLSAEIVRQDVEIVKGGGVNERD